MFDSTGVLEVFCSRIDSSQQEPAAHDDNAQPTSTTQDLFVVNVFLMERFDWMGQEVVSMQFSLDDGPAQHVEYIHRPGCSKVPPRPRAEDEMQFYDGCFEGQRRLDMASAELRPVNSSGQQLVTRERDAGHIVISLQRGHSVILDRGDEDQQQTCFGPAAGAAGFTTHIVFSYDSTYRGIVHMTSTMTYTQTRLPRLELSRALQYDERKRAREPSDDGRDHDSDALDDARPAKAARLAGADTWGYAPAEQEEEAD